MGGKDSTPAPPPVQQYDPNAISEAMAPQLDQMSTMMDMMGLMMQQQAQPPVLPDIPVTEELPEINWTDQLAQFHEEASAEVQDAISQGVASGTLLTSPLLNEESITTITTLLSGS
jgi:hypothetical protein